MGKVGDQLAERGMRDSELLRLFKNAEKELIAIVNRIGADSPLRIYRAEQIRAIDAEVSRLEDRVFRWTQKEIPALFEAGVEETGEAIDALGEEEFSLKFSGISQNAIDVLAKEAFLEFGKTMVNIRNNAHLALIQRQKLQDQLIQGVIEGSSVARTQRQLQKLLQQKGITALRARNGFGRRFTVEHYTNMLVRTQSMTAYNLGARARMLGVGRRFAIFPTIRPDIDGEDICNEWERKKYIDLRKDPLPPQSTHPNCRHSERPVSFAQLQRERPDLYRIALAEWERAAAA